MSIAPSPAQIDRFRELVELRLGLTFDEGRLEYLTDALRQRLLATGAQSVERYLQQLHSAGAAEFAALAPQLTVGETYFFRNADHFRALTDGILPGLIQARQAERSLRILSAGCSSGEEAFTLAILLRERADLIGFRLAISAIDLNRAALARASLATYSAWSLRDTPQSVRSRYFNAVGKEFVLSSNVRDMVQFEERNLAEEDPTFWRTGNFDVIFCRNVTMYFTPEVTRRVVTRFARCLRPGGHLFLGHAETLRGISNDFHLCHTHDTFYYQKRRASELPPPAPNWASRSESGSSPPAAERHHNTVPIDPDASWVEAIQRASDNIALLAGNSRLDLLDADSRTGHDRAQSHGARCEADAISSAHSPPPARTARSERTWNTQHAVALMREERFGEALDYLGSLPEESLLDPDTQLLRAVLLTNMGDLPAAERTCAALLAFDDLNAGAHYLTALAREHVGDLGAAAEHDQVAAYLDPTFAMPRLHLGLLSRRSKNLAVARHELQRALSLLLREDAARILLFGGGFSREALSRLCRTELQALEGQS